MFISMVTSLGAYAAVSVQHKVGAKRRNSSNSSETYPLRLQKLPGIMMWGRHAHVRVHGTSLIVGLLAYIFVYTLLRTGRSSHNVELEKLNSEVKNATDNGSHIWFITAVTCNSVEEAVITQLGQLIFPVRAFVTWVIVVEAESVHADRRKNLTEQMHKLDSLIQRFGFSYVLLHSRMYQEVKMVNLSKSTKALLETSARQTGFIWVLENVQDEIVFMGRSDFAYDYHLFYELRHIKGFASWPVGFTRTLGVSTPVVSEGHVIGYHNGEEYFHDDLMLDLANFAVNINFIRNEMSTENLWKLTFDGMFTAGSLGISVSQIEPLASNCTQIFVWRSTTYAWLLPKRVANFSRFRRTNVEFLMRQVLGRKYNAVVRW